MKQSCFRLFGALLALALLATSAFAALPAVAATTVEQLDITVEELVVGQPLPSTYDLVATPAGSATVNNFRWAEIPYDETLLDQLPEDISQVDPSMFMDLDYTFIDAGTIAEVNKFYACLFFVKPASGYALSDTDTAVTVNGNESMLVVQDVVIMKLYITAYAYNTGETKEITLTVDEPAVGKTPAELAHSVKLDNFSAPIASTSLEWYTSTNATDWSPIAADTVFADGNYYRAQLRVALDRGYTFSTAAKGLVNEAPASALFGDVYDAPSEAVVNGLWSLNAGALPTEPTATTTTATIGTTSSTTTTATASTTTETIPSSITSWVFGDVNGDGKVDMKDVLALRKYLAGMLGKEDIRTFHADLNHDGSIDMKDVLQLRKNLAGVR